MGGMQQITLRLRADQLESIDSGASEYEESRSEHIRRLIDRGFEYGELRADLESRRARIEELEEQLARRSQIEERVDELALEVREGRESVDAPWPVRWVRWWRMR